jgi:hypothetical protein
VVTFPVTFDGSFSFLGEPPTHLIGSGTGSILLDSPGTAAPGNARFYLGSTYAVTSTALPEPGTALLLVTGVAVLLWPKLRNAINQPPTRPVHLLINAEEDGLR